MNNIYSCHIVNYINIINMYDNRHFLESRNIYGDYQQALFPHPPPSELEYLMAINSSNFGSATKKKKRKTTTTKKKKTTTARKKKTTTTRKKKKTPVKKKKTPVKRKKTTTRRKKRSN